MIAAGQKTHPVEWQPILGCSYASAGCRYCKTIHLAGPKLLSECKQRELIEKTGDQWVWTGAVYLLKDNISFPQTIATPTEFILNPHGDTFHENVPDAWIDRCFFVMRENPQHGFQVLTKRAGRMRTFVARWCRHNGPLPANIALGVSCERQTEVAERVRLLLQIEAAIRYVTLYPLLGPIDLMTYLAGGKIQFVAVGWESERPADPNWIAEIEADCAEAGVPCLVDCTLVGEANRAA